MSKKSKQELTHEEEVLLEYWKDTPSIGRNVFRKLKVFEVVSIKWLDIRPQNAMVVRAPENYSDYRTIDVLCEDGSLKRGMEREQVIAVHDQVIRIEPCHKGPSGP